MKKGLLLLTVVCLIFSTGCSTSWKLGNSTISELEFSMPKIETLPVTADLRISETKSTGQAEGRITEEVRLIKEATAKALGQDPPRVDGPDVLVGGNFYVETRRGEMRVTVTGYPAYYHSFRAVTDSMAKAEAQFKADSLRREQYSGMFDAVKTLRELAEEDSGVVETVIADNGNVSVQLSYPAKNAQPKIETVKNNDGTVSTITKQPYHTIPVYNIFGVNTPLAAGGNIGLSIANAGSAGGRSEGKIGKKQENAFDYRFGIGLVKGSNHSLNLKSDIGEGIRLNFGVNFEYWERGDGDNVDYGDDFVTEYFNISANIFHEWVFKVDFLNVFAGPGISMGFAWAEAWNYDPSYKYNYNYDIDDNYGFALGLGGKVGMEMNAGGFVVGTDLNPMFHITGAWLDKYPVFTMSLGFYGGFKF